MGIIEQLAEIKRMDNLEEGRREGAEEATRRFVENLLKDSTFTLKRIASLAGISIEAVQEIKLMSIINQLGERKRQEILKECRASYYCDEYSIPFASEHVERYKGGLRDGVDLATRCIVENFLKDSTYTLKKIASVANTSLDSVKGIKKALRRR